MTCAGGHPQNAGRRKRFQNAQGVPRGYTLFLRDGTPLEIISKSSREHGICSEYTVRGFVFYPSMSENNARNLLYNKSGDQKSL